RMRGLRKVAEQCLLAAAAQNIKKIALLLARLRALLRHFCGPLAPLHRLIAHFSAPSGRFGPIRLPPTQNPLRLKDKTPHSEKCGVRQQSEAQPWLRFLFAVRRCAVRLQPRMA
ncbi:hypothetical protein RSP799_08865, partial [Ralstonia solanacearum]